MIRDFIDQQQIVAFVALNCAMRHFLNKPTFQGCSWIQLMREF